MNKLRVLQACSLILYFPLMIILTTCTTTKNTVTNNENNSPVSTSTTITSLSTSVTTSNDTIVEMMAEKGQIVYAAHCASCHGENGEGGLAFPLIGTKANLAKYDDANGLLNKISSTMPKNSPGSLSQQDNINVLFFLLLQNNEVSGQSLYDPNALSQIKLN